MRLPLRRKGRILIKMLAQNEQCSHSQYETKVPAWELAPRSQHVGSVSLWVGFGGGWVSTGQNGCRRGGAG